MDNWLVVRHGSTAWTSAERVQGWAPVPLSPAGRESAAAVGSYVADEYDVDGVVTSDLRRARETAAAIGDEAGVSVERDPGWRERDFGVYQGLSDDHYHRLDDPFDVEPESGESWAAVAERAEAAWNRLVASRADENVVVVSHYSPMQFLFNALDGRDHDAEPTESPALCAVYEVECAPTDAAPARVEEVFHPE